MDEDRLKEFVQQFLLPHLNYSPAIDLELNMSFRDASVHYVPLGENEAELDVLERITLANQTKCSTEQEITLDEAASFILETETNLDLSQYDLYTDCGGARNSIAEVIKAKAGFFGGRKVAFSSPNWMFDRIITEIGGVEPVSFFARTADEFVERYSSQVDSSYAAVILVDPSNPLGFTMTPEHIAEIEKVSEKYNITPIFDDIFRGLQKRGDRKSASLYSNNSVIVESTSKRFGQRGVGATWTLVPKDVKLKPKIGIPCKGCDAAAGMIVFSLYKCGYDDKVANHISNNAEAFRRGFHLYVEPEKGQFKQAFPSMPLMTYHSNNPEFDSLEIAQKGAGIVNINPGIAMTAEGGMLNLEERAFAKTYMRICPTQTTPDKAYQAGSLLGAILNLNL